MKINSLRRYLFIALLLGACGVFAPAQNRPPMPPPGDAPNGIGGPPRRPDLLQQLGLSPEQLQQIRQINRERKPLMDEAARRLREANRNLDIAIYADNVDENEVQQRLNEFQAAQTEISRLRFMGELQIRRVLTPDQLVKFRDLRAKFAAMMDSQRQNRQMNRQLRNGPPPASQVKPN